MTKYKVTVTYTVLVEEPVAVIEADDELDAIQKAFDNYEDAMYEKVTRKYGDDDPQFEEFIAVKMEE